MTPRAAAAAALFMLASCGDAAEDDRAVSSKEVAKQLSAVEIEPGLWERQTQYVSASAPGMPREIAQRMARRRTSSRHCITPEQARRPEANFLASQQNGNCTYREFEMRGGRMRGRTACRGANGEGETQLSMEGRYGPQSYDMRLDIVTPGMPGGGAMTIVARTSGRRIGDCPVAAAAEQ